MGAGAAVLQGSLQVETSVRWPISGQRPYGIAEIFHPGIPAEEAATGEDDQGTGEEAAFFLREATAEVTGEDATGTAEEGSPTCA